jgi:hypothetical protein
MRVSGLFWAWESVWPSKLVYTGAVSVTALDLDLTSDGESGEKWALEVDEIKLRRLVFWEVGTETSSIDLC